MSGGRDRRWDGAEHPSDDLAPYALGALESAEAAAVERHLEGCERCRAELHWLDPAIDVLPSSVAQLEPPPRLRRNLMRTVRAEARAERGGWWSRRAGWITLRARPAIAIGAMAVLGAAVAGYAIKGTDSGPSPTPTVTEFNAEAPGPLSDAAGVLTRSDGGAVLRVDHLPELDSGDVYQLWVREGNVMRPARAFTLDEHNRAEAEIAEVPAGADEVLVTREPHPGRKQPSSAPLLRAPLG